MTPHSKQIEYKHRQVFCAGRGSQDTFKASKNSFFIDPYHILAQTHLSFNLEWPICAAAEADSASRALCQLQPAAQVGQSKLTLANSG